MVKLGALECLTNAPEDYDYSWMRTLKYNVAIDDRGKVYRLARNEDQWHFDNQVMRYGSGMNVTITSQKDLDDRLRLGFLSLTPEKEVSVHYIKFDLENFIGSDDTTQLDNVLENLGDSKPIWRKYEICFRIVGDEEKNRVVGMFENIGVNPIDY